VSNLKLTNVKKSYLTGGGEVVQALKGISLEFRKSELVSILGPSGCGKTTLLNIIGGLDRYDEGDLSLGGRTTKKFKDRDWDAYRNHSVGFVFQNYNLISHQTVLQNVEIALTLSGIPVKERRERAKQALVEVGLGEKLSQKPNQLSGGQMQRVAIARALVNNPSIILADEPTGALDSQTSVQVMDILKDIAKTKLVIMVTHNSELAEEYSSRVINLRDGEVQSDTNPILKDGNRIADTQANDGLSLGKTSMSLSTAMLLSLKNLLTKKGRTFITSFAGSIGIIGIALVLALSTGLSNYIANLQSETLSTLPITISAGPQASSDMPDDLFGNNKSGKEKYPEEDVLYRYQPIDDASKKEHVNVFTTEFFDLISKMPSDLPDSINTIILNRDVEANVLAKGEADVVKFETKVNTTDDMSPFAEASPNYWNQLPDDQNFILSMYDLIGEGSRYPTEANEVAIVVNDSNGISNDFFDKLGMFETSSEYKLSNFIGKTILKYIPNDIYYKQNENGYFTQATPELFDELYNNNDGLALTVTAVLRPKEESTSNASYLPEGLVYTTALMNLIIKDASSSVIAIAQQSSERDVILNTPFINDEVKAKRLRDLGVDTTPVSINIYAKDFSSKDKIKKYLDTYYNQKNTKEKQIQFTDRSEMIGSTIQSAVDIFSSVLIGFASISLVVSTIMIGIITYVSVLERTKEIGILRSLGARKKDVSRVFNAETLIVGFVSGALGIGVSYMFVIIINAIIENFLEIQGIAVLTLDHSVILVVGSMLLTLLAGFIPARIATKKDPVLALRTE